MDASGVATRRVYAGFAVIRMPHTKLVVLTVKYCTQSCFIVPVQIGGPARGY
jgi:hypothetical protein